MHPKLRDIWTTIQRAETLLFRAAALPNLPRYRQLIDEIGADSDSRNLLIRMVNGFDPDDLSAEDYLVRYPFSSAEAIRASLERLVASGHVAAKDDGNFAATESGKQAIRVWQQGVSAMMQAVDLGDIPQADVLTLLGYDQRILEAIRQARQPHGNPIFNHRLRGLHPSYEPPALWHHWMHIWTMLAASEDEEEYIRQHHGMDPLVWFVRRQIWFVHRRPWRARARTLNALIQRAMGYSPIDRAEAACTQAVRDLKERGWLEEVDGEFRLTEEGLAICDEDEREVDECFLSCWPAFREAEIEELLGIATRLNERFEELIRQAQE